MDPFQKEPERPEDEEEPDKNAAMLSGYQAASKYGREMPPDHHQK